MPLVFVHGVATRDGGSYEENVAARNALFRDVALTGIADPDALKILNPYWGGLGAKLAFNNASLPQGDYESLGAEDEVPVRALAESTSGTLDGETMLRDLARESLVDAVDLLWAVAGDGANEESAGALSGLAVRSVDYALNNPDPAWLAAVENDNQFLTQLQIAVDEWEIQGSLGTGPEAEEWESLGFSEVWDRVREGAARLKSSAGRLVSEGLVAIGREGLHRNLINFLGDIFVYLDERGTRDNPGSIPTTIISALRDAAQRKTSGDDKLIVVAHSMGGNIVYDVLTHFAPDIEIDVLVTVGSQVGLFEELKLYVVSDEKIPGPSGDRAVSPPQVKNWINIFDDQDVLSFVTKPIFGNVIDFRYNTGKGVHGAHTTYFVRPSFHRRLHERLEETLSG